MTTERYTQKPTENSLAPKPPTGSTDLRHAHDNYVRLEDDIGSKCTDTNKDETGLNELAVETSFTLDKTGQDQMDDMSQHAGEEQVDIGLKDLPLTGAPNIYVGKRNFIHQLMDVALLMANVSQLKALLSIDSSDKYFYPLLVFIILSITLQVVFTVTMLLIWSIEKGLEERSKKALADSSDIGSVVMETELKKVDEKKQVLADRLDKFGNILVLSIIVSNVFITGFGVEPHDTGTSSASNG